LQPTRRACFEHVVHTEDVKLEGDPGRVLAAEPIRKVDGPLRLGGDHCRHDVVELTDIAAQHFHLMAKRAKIGGLRIDVHTDDLFAALRQERNKPSPDKAGAAGDKRGHSDPSRIALAVRTQPEVTPTRLWK